MRIAILGSRGIPARYAGFETCAEELSKRLAERGHEVTVYCCRPYSITNERYINGVRRIIVPTIREKHLEKLLFSIICLIHVAVTRNEVILMLGLNIPVLFILPRMFRKKIAVNVDGLEWKRKKWGRFASRYLLFCEKVAGYFSHQIITDARCIQSYYLKTYRMESTFIPYGTEVAIITPGDTLKKYGLKKDDYILYVSRFSPENNPLLVREAFEEIKKQTKKIVLVGDSPFDEEYIRKVRDTQNPNIIFTGTVYGEGYKELLSNAYFYIQATEVGGTHPALVEALGYGNFVLANDVAEHREVLRDAGMYYRGKKDLIDKMQFLLDNPHVVLEGRVKSQKIVKEDYSWETVSDSYEKLFEKMIND